MTIKTTKTDAESSKAQERMEENLRKVEALGARL